MQLLIAAFPAVEEEKGVNEQREIDDERDIKRVIPLECARLDIEVFGEVCPHTLALYRGAHGASSLQDRSVPQYCSKVFKRLMQKFDHCFIASSTGSPTNRSIVSLGQVIEDGDGVLLV